MIVSFKDLYGKVQRVSAKIKTRHSLSPQGQPVLVLSDGETVDQKSWVGLGYQVVSAMDKELQGLSKIGLI